MTLTLDALTVPADQVRLDPATADAIRALVTPRELRYEPADYPGLALTQATTGGALRAYRELYEQQNGRPVGADGQPLPVGVEYDGYLARIAQHLGLMKRFRSTCTMEEAIARLAETQEPAEPTEQEAAETELDQAIAGRRTADNRLRSAMLAARKAGVSANEIARRVQVAGIQSRPTTLLQLNQSAVYARASDALSTARVPSAWLGQPRSGVVTVQLEMDPDRSTATRWNAAARVISALQEAGLRLSLEGDQPWADMQEHLGELRLAEVHSA